MPPEIQSILHDLKLTDDKVKPKDIPMASSRILHRHPESPTFDGNFNYHSIIGRLNYLEKASRPDLSYSVQQCTRFSADPKL